MMKKIVLLSRVARLAKEVEREYVDFGQYQKTGYQTRRVSIARNQEQVAALVSTYDAGDGDESVAWETAGSSLKETEESSYVIDPAAKNVLTGQLTESQRVHIERVLGDWEEPEKTWGVEVSHRHGYAFTYVVSYSHSLYGHRTMSRSEQFSSFDSL